MAKEYKGKNIKHKKKFRCSIKKERNKEKEMNENELSIMIANKMCVKQNEVIKYHRKEFHYCRWPL